jgi:hypothetical protein
MKNKNVLIPELAELNSAIANQTLTLLSETYMKHRDKSNTIVSFTGILEFNFTVKDPEGNTEVITTESRMRS